MVMSAADPALSLHIVTAGSILLFKLGVLVVGFLIARLGYQLLLQGVKGGFTFHGKYRETTLDLMSASPGIFFIFLATVLLIVGVIKDKPFGTLTSSEPAAHCTELRGGTDAQSVVPPKPTLPPPKE